MIKRKKIKVVEQYLHAKRADEGEELLLIDEKKKTI